MSGMWASPPPREPWYDVAQLCLNGHLINDMAQSASYANREFCERCGERTIMQCPSCAAPVPGDLHYPNVVGASSFVRPSFCGTCGAQMPWTVRALAAAMELASYSEGLSVEDKEVVGESLDELVKDSARTTVVATRFKGIMARANLTDAMRQILIDVVSETAKKIVWGPHA